MNQHDSSFFSRDDAGGVWVTVKSEFREFHYYPVRNCLSRGSYVKER